MEFEHAEVLGYPCDTIRMTEGFSVTTMEACASGCLPVITDIDSLGHIYGDAAPMIHLNGKVIDEYIGPLAKKEWAQVGGHLGAFTDLLVRGLTDEAWRAEHVAKCRALAKEHAWPVLAERLEGILTQGIVRRNLAGADLANPDTGIRVEGGGKRRKLKGRGRAVSTEARDISSTKEVDR